MDRRRSASAGVCRSGDDWLSEKIVVVLVGTWTKMFCVSSCFVVMKEWVV